MRSEFQIRLRSVRRRSLANVDSVERSWACPVERVSLVRNTAVVCCIVRCIESRRVEVGVEPFELRKVSISEMESKPMLSGTMWWAAEGAWLEET
jgi:hypothetical protein